MVDRCKETDGQKRGYAQWAQTPQHWPTERVTTCAEASGISTSDTDWGPVCAQVQSEILQSVDVEDIESALRGCLLKLQYANASLGPCKEGKLSPVQVCGFQQHMQSTLNLSLQEVLQCRESELPSGPPSYSGYTGASRITAEQKLQSLLGDNLPAYT